MRNILCLLCFVFFKTFSFCQQIRYVDFKTAHAQIEINNPKLKTINGYIKYRFDILKNTDSIYFDARHFKDVVCTLNAKPVTYTSTKKHITIKQKFKKGHTYSATIKWRVTPKKALYFIDHNLNVSDQTFYKQIINKQVWTQGQGKYTSHWLPSFDDMNEKVIFNLKITTSKHYQAMANGVLTAHGVADSTNNYWQYRMQKPMSSYLVALAIGKYKKQEKQSKSGVPLINYYYPKDSLKIAPTYRYSKQIFDFFEDEIDVSYPWQNYKQVPVKDFLYAGMENTSLTIFSDAFMVNENQFVDKNYVNVQAHELAHQWFGNLVTETSGTHHWLQEGFATYYALLAERHIYGDNYYYWQLYKYAQDLLEQDKLGLSTALLNPKSSSTTFYKKGAWLLHILRNKIGDTAFKSAVKNYLNAFKFKNVNTNHFIQEAEKSSGLALDNFVKTWLEDKTFYYQQCLENLRANNTEINTFLDLENKLSTSSKANKLFYSIKSDKVKTEILLQSNNLVLSTKAYKRLLKTKNIKLRQAVAKKITKIDVALKKDYELLLKDSSFITRETALFNLWKNFPAQRQHYLNVTKNDIGFNNKNMRLLWLTLALITPDFNPDNKADYLDELTRYTHPVYGFEIRQQALQYLNQIQACNALCKKHLKDAATHHNWQFSKFAKHLLKSY